MFVHICMCVCEEYSHAVSQGLLLLYLCNQSMFYVTQGETKVLKLKNLRPKDFANYTCEVTVRNVCDIPESSVTFRLTNATSKRHIVLPIIILHPSFIILF